MVNNFLKIGALIVTGRFLKPRFKGLLILIIFWFIVRFLHGEYMEYVKVSGNTDYLVTVILAKIGLYVLAFLVYVFTVERKILLRTQKEIQQQRVQEHTETKDDGFDFLRQKKKLRSPADQLLNKD